MILHFGSKKAKSNILLYGWQDMLVLLFFSVLFLRTFEVFDLTALFSWFCLKCCINIICLKSWYRVLMKNCNDPQLIVMLTYNDHTLENAVEIFEQCENSNAKIFGFKETGLPIEKMKALYSYMNKCGKTTVLEVVAYTEKECMEGAQLAAECGCSILMGTMFFDSVNEFCKANRLKYMPFIGKVTDRPSVLEGTIDKMLDEANRCLEKGVFGFDLLGYRYTGDAVELIEKFVSHLDAPVCVAGSINSYERLDEVRNAGAWAFTIGGAFIENKFDGTYEEQINKVCEYVTLDRKTLINV